jgi:DNA-3-methyladenine glycosylase
MLRQMHSVQVTTKNAETLAEWLAAADDASLRRRSIQREWFERDTITVARELLGTILVRRSATRKILAARIVETEAYLPDDPASHSWSGMTARNRAMFASGGCLYVYQIYGVHRCVNIVTDREGIGAAVLLRAAEPLMGIEEMVARRGRNLPRERLLSGPANLARCFGFELDDNGCSCCGEGTWILPPVVQPSAIGISPRIGITRGKELLLRFFEPNSPAISAHRRATVLEPVVH